MKVDICVPVYNEARILEANAKRLLEYCLRSNFGFDWRVMLVINGSTDDSLSIAKRVRQELPGFVQVVQAKFKGKGAALKECWSSSEADVLLYMDSDLAVSLEDIEKLTDGIMNEGFDLVVGSRLLPESAIDRSLWRELVSLSYIRLSRLILGHRFSDLQCGFKAIKRDVFLSIAPYIEEEGWFFDTELMVFAEHCGYKVKEVPVHWEENRYAQRQSKVNVLLDSWRFLMETIHLRRRLLKNNRLK